MDIWSSFGCFTKPFSNTGGLLTYLIPPKTSIIGMVAAILGYEFNNFKELKDGTKKYKIEELYDIKVSIQALFDLKVKKVTFNSHYGNERYKAMLNVKQDVLINPFYKIYLSFPYHLKSKERDFLESINNNETVYNLYMGKNEFFMNYELKNYLENVETELITTESKDKKIYGTLDKRIVETAKLRSDTTEEIIFKGLMHDTIEYANYYEYIIRDYPIRRYNFIDFDYIPLSFYSMKDENGYFGELSLKENTNLELHKIGENQWISLI